MPMQVNLQWLKLLKIVILKIIGYILPLWHFNEITKLVPFNSLRFSILYLLRATGLEVEGGNTQQQTQFTITRKNINQATTSFVLVVWQKISPNNNSTTFFSYNCKQVCGISHTHICTGS